MSNALGKISGKAGGSSSASAPQFLWRVCAMLFSTAALIAGCGRTGTAADIDPNDPQQVRAGEALYRQHCAACHGVRLEGQPEWRRRLPSGRMPAPPHDATGHTWHHPNEVLFGITRDGMVPPWAPEGHQSDMPGFGRVLTDEDIRAVLAYIQSTWPEEVVTMRRQMLEQMQRR